MRQAGKATGNNDDAITGIKIRSNDLGKQRRDVVLYVTAGHVAFLRKMSSDSSDI